MSKLFNAQNLSQRKTRFSTVWLNIKDFSCSSWEFIGVTPGGDAFPATQNDFLLTQTRKINYAYAGGINECDYVESTTLDRNNNTVFLYELRKVSIQTGGYTYQLYNLPKAAFMNGSPVVSISVRIIPGEADISFSPLSNQYSNFIKAYSELHASSQEVQPGFIPEDLGDGTTMWWVVPQFCHDGEADRVMTQTDLYNIGLSQGPAFLRRIHVEALTQSDYETEYPVLSWFPRFGFSGTTPVWYLSVFLNVPDYINPNAFEFDLENPEPSGGYWYQAIKIGPSGAFTPHEGEWGGSAYLEMIITN